MPDYKNYQLVGGQPVNIVPLTVSASGTTIAPAGTAYNPVICQVSGALEEKSVSVVANGTQNITPSTGKEGMSKVVLTTAVPAYLTALTSPYAADDGTYIFVGVTGETTSVVGICTIADGAVTESYGDGTFAVSTGETPELTWTPSATASSVTCWFAASVA